MNAPLSFCRTRNLRPATPKRRAGILDNPGFGSYFTDHMVTVKWSTGQGWHDSRLEPYQPFELDPAATVFHYGQAIFEGLKAYGQRDGSVASFRPDANAQRFRDSARRIAMPELPERLFMQSLRELVNIDKAWVSGEAGNSLYLRPFMISTQATLGVNKPASTYLYCLIASPSGSYFVNGIKPVTLWLSHEYSRASPGGTGAAKFAGNYAAAFLAQQRAAEKGCDQVVWLDAVDRTSVDEMGGMNLFFVFGSGHDAKLVTPSLTGNLLPGITRSS